MIQCLLSFMILSINLVHQRINNSMA